MNEHPIEGLMKTAMSSIEQMVDVNTIVGEPIQIKPGTVIIPVSKVCFGFAAGGSEYNGEVMKDYKKIDREETVEYKLPFGGGSGGTVCIKPVAFVTICDDTIKINPIEHVSVLDKLIDYVPDFMKKLNINPDKIFEKCDKVKKDFDYELSKKECNCKKQNENKSNVEEDNNNDNNDNNDENFVPEKSKVKSVTSLESNKGPITRKKIKIEYEDENEEEQEEINDDENLDLDDNQDDKNMEDD